MFASNWVLQRLLVNLTISIICRTRNVISIFCRSDFTAFSIFCRSILCCIRYFDVSLFRRIRYCDFSIKCRFGLLSFDKMSGIHMYHHFTFVYNIE